MNISAESDSNNFISYNKPVLSGIVLLAIGLALILELPQEFLISFADNFSGHKLNRVFWGCGISNAAMDMILVGSFLLIFRFLNSTNVIGLSYILASIAAISVFVYRIFRDSINVPITDDFTAILGFLNLYADTQGFENRITLIFSQHVECRLIFSRCIFLFERYFFGSINFRHLIYFGNAALLLSSLLLFRTIRLNKFRSHYFLVIGLLLFQFQFYDCILWATVTIHYQWMILFTLLTLTLLPENKTRSFTFACIFAILAILTFGNALLLIPIGMVVLVFQKRYMNMMIWSLAGLLVFVLYFMNYSFTRHAPINAETLIGYLFFSFIFLGSSFQYLYGMYLPALAGFFIWTFFILLTFKKYYLKNSTIYFLFAFLIASSLLSAVFRGRAGIEIALSGRYGFFSVLTLVCVFIAFIESFPANAKAFPIILVAALLFHLLSDTLFYPEIVLRKEKLKAFILETSKGHPENVKALYLPDNAGDIIKESCTRNIFCPKPDSKP